MPTPYTNPPAKKYQRPNYRTYQAKAEALRRKARRNNMPCWICGQPINWQAHWKQPDSYTADHVEPLHAGGRINGELRPAHRSCNTRRSNHERAGTRLEARPVVGQIRSATSRKW